MDLGRFFFLIKIMMAIILTISLDSLSSSGVHAVRRAIMEERDAVVAESVKGDKVSLKGLIFHGFHGVLAEEKKLGQKFMVDVDAWTDLRAAGKSDNLPDSVDYTDIYGVVKEVIEGEPHNLVESVAEEIAAKTLRKDDRIYAVCVKVNKPHVAVNGVVEYLGIKIHRERSDLPELNY